MASKKQRTRKGWNPNPKLKASLIDDFNLSIKCMFYIYITTFTIV